MQGAAVRIWVGAIDPATGAVVPDPDSLGEYTVDVPILISSEKNRRVSLQLVSALERAFDTDRGNTLSSAFHQSVWSGELGLQYVTGVAQRIYWGQRMPARGPVGFVGEYTPSGGPESWRQPY